ncbi:murein hydrolase activator EnvC family protein [Algiphilus sp.]|uniref:murein hydrolase activator EnvC family protein n=1 Tax=Algiphilus sp. TaxID=1872431 RepID=UPI003B518B32
MHLRAMLLRPFLLATLCALTQAVAADDYAQRQQELRKVQERIQALDAQLAEQSERQSALREALADVERAASAAADKLAKTREALRDLQARQRQASTAVREAEAELRRREEALAQQLRAAWRLGRQPQLKLLLQQDGPERLSRMHAYFARIGEATMEDIARTRTLQAEHEAAVARLADTQQRLQAAESEQQALLAAQKRRREQRAATLDALKRRMADDRSALADARADREALERLVQGLRNALADIPADVGKAKPLTTLRGQLPWPLQGPVLAAFGSTRPSGMPWKGIWVGAETGAPARAIAPGRVAWAGWMHRYGLVVIVEHQGGFYSLYGHAQRSLRTVGEWVDTGTVLVTAGDSGGQARSGIYLELRKGADPVDPIAWLRARG